MEKKFRRPLFFGIGLTLLACLFLGSGSKSITAYAAESREECQPDANSDCRSSSTSVIYCGYKLVTVETEL